MAREVLGERVIRKGFRVYMMSLSSVVGSLWVKEFLRASVV